MVYYSCSRRNQLNIHDIANWTRQQRCMCLTSEGGGRTQSFTQAAPNELKLARWDQVVSAGHRLGGASWGESETGEED